VLILYKSVNVKQSLTFLIYLLCYPYILHFLIFSQKHWKCIMYCDFPYLTHTAHYTISAHLSKWLTADHTWYMVNQQNCGFDTERIHMKWEENFYLHTSNLHWLQHTFYSFLKIAQLCGRRKWSWVTIPLWLQTRLNFLRLGSHGGLL
jgi:hypothetical protein